jgi:hypothetical protein
MTGGGNGIVMIQQNRGSGTFGTYTTTGNQIHDNIIVDHDGEGYIGGVADYNQSGMLNGGTSGATINTSCLMGETGSSGVALKPSPNSKAPLTKPAQSHNPIPTRVAG